MRKIGLILLALPFTTIAQGKFTGGDGSGFHFAEITILESGEVLAINEVTQLTVYPNPTQGLLNFSYPINQQIEIRDLQGRLHAASSSTPLTLDVTPLTSGVYFIIYKDKQIRFRKE